MNSYIGCKIIQATPKTYGEYRLEKYENIFTSSIKDDEEGYMVIYPPIGDNLKPHISWSPKEVFEKAYRLIELSERQFILGSD
jgi:hypothetical protein